MKNRLFLLSLLLAVVAIVMAVVIIISVTATAAPDTSPGNGINITPAPPTRSDDRNSETPEIDTTPPRRINRGDSGEVEYPMMPRGMRTPTIPPTTVPVTPTVPPTTVPAPPPTVPPTVPLQYPRLQYPPLLLP